MTKTDIIETCKHQSHWPNSTLFLPRVSALQSKHRLKILQQVSILQALSLITLKLDTNFVLLGKYLRLRAQPTKKRLKRYMKTLPKLVYLSLVQEVLVQRQVSQELVQKPQPLHQPLILLQVLLIFQNVLQRSWFWDIFQTDSVYHHLLLVIQHYWEYFWV